MVACVFYLGCLTSPGAVSILKILYKQNESQMDQLTTEGVGGGGAVAQSVERATPGEEVPGSITAVAARSLLVGSVSV